jgi:hypothetical protein
MAIGLVLPVGAHAAIDVTRDAATGGLAISSAVDAADAVTLARTDAGALRISASGGTAPTSSDATCSAAADDALALDCTAASGTKVAINLGGGADRLDATAAFGVRLRVNGGPGIDTLVLGSSGTTTVVDGTAQDTVDLSHADSSIRVRYERAAAHLVARCSGCAAPGGRLLPTAPRTGVLGADADDVKQAAWRTRGRATWILGNGDDRFWGAPSHRSIVSAGKGWDTLVSSTAVDTLRGDTGMDRIADFGGTGDVLLGGADTDSIGSLDSRRDIIDGGASPDQCLSTSRKVAGCDTRPGGVRNMEQASYLPVHGQRLVLTSLGISR